MTTAFRRHRPRYRRLRKTTGVRGLAERHFNVQAAKSCPCISPQSPLQLLVLIQEQERMQLLQLLGGITLQDLQEKHPNAHPGKGEAHLLLFLAYWFPIQNLHIFHADDLRNGCVKKLRQIHADLLAQNAAREPPVHQRGPKTQPSNELRSKQQVALCSLHLLEELMELQEVQASALMHKVSQGSHSVSSTRPTLMHGCSAFVH